MKINKKIIDEIILQWISNNLINSKNGIIPAQFNAFVEGFIYAHFYNNETLNKKDIKNILKLFQDSKAQKEILGFKLKEEFIEIKKTSK